MTSTGAAVDWDELLATPEVDQLIDLALYEDLREGDVTTDAIFTAPVPATGSILTKSPTVVCGLPLVEAVLDKLEEDGHRIIHSQPEGTLVEPDAQLWTAEADAALLLKAERTILNFLMRLCGVAANAQRATRALPFGSHTRILDTRKTLPGWRLLDKAAILTGGAFNHRMSLFDAVLIKDNHIAAAGSISAAVGAVRKMWEDRFEIQVEVDELGQIEEALAAGADSLLLDNFGLEALEQARRLVAGRVPLEASGGVTEQSLTGIANTGVDQISIGALTHTVSPPDLSLELICGEPGAQDHTA